MLLSVIVPVYNEIATIERMVEAVLAVPVRKEILLVDDGSTDGTAELLRSRFGAREGVKVFHHEKNGGKGRAIRTGLAAASGDAVVIQDADLEYDPNDYVRLLEALEASGANVVYGSRFLSGAKVTSAFHRFVNWFLTSATNLLYGSRLTDMETCYKLFRAKTLRGLGLSSDGFEIEPEITAKALRAGERIFEVPVSYKGRSFHEGKKIGWQDGFKSLWALFKWRFA